MPVSKCNLSLIAARGDTCRAALLLPAIDPVRELVVGDDVIELRRRLVVPTAPGAPAVDGDGRALINREQDNLRIVRVDPDAVIIVAARRAFPRREGCASVGGLIGRDVGDVNCVGIFRVGFDFGKVRAAPPQARVFVDAPPAFARII